jgi:hypothetical protein
MVSPVSQQPQLSQNNSQGYEIVTGPDGRRYERRPDGLYPEGHKSIYPGEGKTVFVGSSAIATKSMTSGSPSASKVQVKK